MTDLITEIKTAITSRLKAPLLGNLAISFLLCNYKGIGVFLLSDNVVRKQILLNYNNIIADITCALFITFLYVGVSQFIIPYIQDKIDKLKLEKVDIKRYEQRTSRLKEDFGQQAKSNEMLVKSEANYLRERALRELSEWEEERKQLNQIKQQLEDTKIELSQSKARVSQLEYLDKIAKDTQEQLNIALNSLASFNIELQQKSVAFTDSIISNEQIEMAMESFESANFVEIYKMPPGDEMAFNAILSLSKQVKSFAHDIDLLKKKSSNNNEEMRP